MADFANSETCSLISLNDAFQKTLLQASKDKSRKLTDHRKQLLSGALISNVIVCYNTVRVVEMIGGREGWGGGGWGKM